MEPHNNTGWIVEEILQDGSGHIEDETRFQDLQGALDYIKSCPTRMFRVAAVRGSEPRGERRHYLRRDTRGPKQVARLRADISLLHFHGSLLLEGCAKCERFLEPDL